MHVWKPQNYILFFLHFLLLRWIMNFQLPILPFRYVLVYIDVRGSSNSLPAVIPFRSIKYILSKEERKTSWQYIRFSNLKPELSPDINAITQNIQIFTHRQRHKFEYCSFARTRRDWKLPIYFHFFLCVQDGVCVDRKKIEFVWNFLFGL